MERRDFVIGCAAAGAAEAFDLGAAQAALAEIQPKLYQKARLVDGDGKPLKVRALPVRQNLMFHYPFVSTPAFLLNLGQATRNDVELTTSDHQTYRWQGGVGPARAVVAFSAICAHKLVYPMKEVSFISFRDGASPRSERTGVIHCCAENSQYDPADGARVVAGPAPQPLAAILLDYDPKTDELSALGTVGGELFDAFFSKYDFRLSMDHGTRSHQAVGNTCVVQPMDKVCRQQIRC